MCMFTTHILSDKSQTKITSLLARFKFLEMENFQWKLLPHKWATYNIVVANKVYLSC